MKIFGREPAVWVGLIEAVLMLAGTQFFDWSVEQVAVVVAVVNGVFGAYLAWATKDTMLGALVGLAKASITLSIAFGVSVGDDLAAQIIALVTMAVAFYQRTQTFPLADPPKPAAGAVAVSDVGAV